ncbi:unnamed protein product [Amoebophrya sp. A25]|nr:unnamed protein product [Amoebophrya sp. A25]|eukprot:GSA25T00025168001.1
MMMVRTHSNESHVSLATPVSFPTPSAAARLFRTSLLQGPSSPSEAIAAGQRTEVALETINLDLHLEFRLPVSPLLARSFIEKVPRGNLKLIELGLRIASDERVGMPTKADTATLLTAVGPGAKNGGAEGGELMMRRQRGSAWSTVNSRQTGNSWTYTKIARYFLDADPEFWVSARTVRAAAENQLSTMLWSATGGGRTATTSSIEEAQTRWFTAARWVSSDEADRIDHTARFFASAHVQRSFALGEEGREEVLPHIEEADIVSAAGKLRLLRINGVGSALDALTQMDGEYPLFVFQVMTEWYAFALLRTEPEEAKDWKTVRYNVIRVLERALRHVCPTPLEEVLQNAGGNDGRAQQATDREFLSRPLSAAASSSSGQPGSGRQHKSPSRGNSRRSSKDSCVSAASSAPAAEQNLQARAERGQNLVDRLAEHFSRMACKEAADRAGLLDQYDRHQNFAGAPASDAADVESEWQQHQQRADLDEPGQHLQCSRGHRGAPRALLRDTKLRRRIYALLKRHSRMADGFDQPRTTALIRKLTVLEQGFF